MYPTEQTAEYNDIVLGVIYKESKAAWVCHGYDVLALQCVALLNILLVYPSCPKNNNFTIIEQISTY